MKIKTFVIGYFIIMIFLASTDFMISYKLEAIENRILQANKQRQQLLSLVDELRMSSEFLTAFSRRYVVTRNEHVLTYYYNILAIRDGKIPRPDNYNNMYWDLVVAGALEAPNKTELASPSLIDRFVLAGVTVNELERLNEAKNASDKLARLELVAIHAADGEFDDGTEAFSIRKKPDEKLAVKLLNDKAYMDEKSKVIKPISDLIVMITTRVNSELTSLTKRSSDLVRKHIMVALARFYNLCSGVFFVFYIVGIRSSALLSAVKKIAKRDFNAQINMSGDDELAELATAINIMKDDLKLAFESLNEKIHSAETSAIELEQERQRSEKLLYNILPAVIADRLRNGEKLIAETYQEVTVMFADIVGFTHLSSQLGPYKTVHMLNDVFGRFDNLLEAYEIEKIKTIGDCYMVVAGVPKRNPLHCQQMAQFALNIVRSLEEYSANSPFDLKIRIGLHTGTVTAGIIGENKFSYDLWGEVVNLASRLESTSIANRIHVSEAVKTRLSEDFVFEDNGSIELKGFGTIHSWFLIGEKNSEDIIELKSRKIISLEQRRS